MKNFSFFNHLTFFVEKWVLLCLALSLNILILQLKLRKRFGETTIKKIWDGNKIEKKGDLNSPISPISKTSFFWEGFKNDSTTDREIENELNLTSLDI